MRGEVSYDIDGFDAFRQRARADNMSDNEKAGFPEWARSGRSETILRDIEAKVPAFAASGSCLLDIGIGLGDLGRHIINRAVERQQRLTLIDSGEVLCQLPDHSLLTKIEGPYPNGIATLAALGPFDGILSYSTVQYVFAEANIFNFLDAAMAMLNPAEGALLLGDIPNASMRRRFLASPAGKAHHAQHYSGLPAPDIRFNAPDPVQINDSIVLALLSRARAAGYQAFVMPQGRDLPMANRREDLLIRVP